MAHATAGEAIGRALVRCGLAAMSPSQIAAFDPYASSDPNVVLMGDLLRSLGTDLSSTIKAGLYKRGTLTTAGGATSYPLPADYNGMADQTGWNGFIPMLGPVTQQRAAFLRAWTPAGILRIPFQLQGTRFEFPVAPADGLTLHYDYVSSYWAQSSGAASPDKAYPTTASDMVMFDDELMVLGLVLRWRTAKRMDTVADLAAYRDRLDVAQGQAQGGQVLSLEGPRSGIHFLDEQNIPPTGYGIP